MRYDSSNLSEMNSRLVDLNSNFERAVAEGGSNVYVGPKVDNPRSIRLQDFVPVSLVPILRERLLADIHALSPHVQ